MADPLTSFRPLLWARGPVAQTALAQLRFRTWGRNEMARHARPEVLRLSEGVSVQGFFSRQLAERPRGLLVMLSGWEGHAGSPYMLRMGRTAYRAGYEVFRINYPDHGQTHDLNESAFHFGMLDKMGEAIHRVASAVRTRPLFVLGFSLGGNLALHLACRGAPGLKAVFAVSPAMDFVQAFATLQGSLFHRFFLRSWKRSLSRKQQLFPGRHDYSGLNAAQTVREVAEGLLAKQGTSQSLEEYARRYSVTPSMLGALCVPAHLLAAVDDPIVGALDYSAYRDVPRLHLELREHGGHVGFMSSLFGPAHYEGLLMQWLRSYEAETVMAARD